MTYHFQPGQRATVSVWGLPDSVHQHLGTQGDQPGRVIADLPASGTPTRDGLRRDRVRVKLDAWPRPLIFDKADVSPVREG